MKITKKKVHSETVTVSCQFLFSFFSLTIPLLYMSEDYSRPTNYYYIDPIKNPSNAVKPPKTGDDAATPLVSG